MSSIRVNIDYESELFYGNGGGPAFNQNLEFLGLFLDKRPLYSNKQYSSEYLHYISSITGRVPEIKSSGNFVNWWGPLKNRDLEKKLNSKITSTELVIKQKWCSETFIIKTMADLPVLKDKKIYMAKSPHEMSGRSFKLIDSSQKDENRKWFEKNLQKSPLILEPFFDRKFDFSHYIFPDGKIICYENKVDEKFQYKGTVFSDHHHPRLESLPFYHLIAIEEWTSFSKALKIIIDSYRHSSLDTGFSIDSFVYEEDGKLKIRFLSEVNYRRTMGCTAYELSEVYAQGFPWTAFIITKSFGNFTLVKEKIKNLGNVFLLSPGDTRFDLFFLKAKNLQEGRELVKELNDLLPASEFSIEL